MLISCIQRWSIIKNSAVDILDERAIDAFTLGLRRGDLVEEMGRIKPRTVLDLMDIGNRFVDGEDACNNKRMRSPEDDRENRYSSQWRRSRNYDYYGSHSQVAAGYKSTLLIKEQTKTSLHTPRKVYTDQSGTYDYHHRMKSNYSY
jgi:hypothetical protein